MISMFNTINRVIKKINKLENILNNLASQLQVQNKLTAELVGFLRVKHATNQFSRIYSKKGFSQSDEDGLLSEIINRLNISKGGVFIELGIGNGLENNTFALLLGGWSGVWISGQDIEFEANNIKNLCFIKDWITKENIANLAHNGLNSIQKNLSDVILLSIDLDGNDYYILSQLLEIERLRPEIIICEYNASFGSHIHWIQKYDPDHKWISDQYFGASYSSFVSLCASYGYKPVCCNPRTGANIFFVRDYAIKYFPEIPEDLAQIFEDGFYQVNNKFLHRISSRLVNKTFGIAEQEK